MALEHRNRRHHKNRVDFSSILFCSIHGVRMGKTTPTKMG